MKKLLYLIPFFFLQDIALAQNSELDSLRNELKRVQLQNEQKKIQSKMQIQKSLDSIKSLMNQPNVQQEKTKMENKFLTEKQLDSLRDELKNIQSKREIQKSIDSIKSLINQPNVQPVNLTKKVTRLDKIMIEIDSLNKLKQNGKYAIFMGLGVQVVAYLSLSSALASDIEINSSGKLANKPTDKAMMYAGLVFGTVLELVGVYNYFEAANRLAQVEAKKYDLMEDN